jgi:flagellar hook-associated protein 3 FlgL
MKLSFVSSTAIQNAMRQTMRSTQNQLTQVSQEATTGVYADIGLALGGNTAQSVDLNQEISRIAANTSSNSIVNGRLTTSQQALSAMSTQAQDMLNQLVALRGDADSSSISTSQQIATSSLQSFISSGNTMQNGEYIFAGISTDKQPMTDMSSSVQSAIQNNLQQYAAANGTSVDKLTGDQMNDFVTNYVAPMFTEDSPSLPSGASSPPFTDISTLGWSSWSQASSTNISSRITSTETITSSTNTDEGGMRYLAMASMLTTSLTGQGLSSDALNAVSDQAISYTRQGIDGLTQQQSSLGLSQSRVSKANDALSAQKDIIQNRIIDLTGVDKTEASTQINLLQTQLETAYTIVGKIQQLSLVNYL